MTQEFTDLITEKILKPKKGWDIEFLKNYGFNFFGNNIIKTNIEIVIKILNDNLPYFYYCVPIQNVLYVTTINASVNKRQIVIDSKYISSIEKISKLTIKSDKKNFSKSILDYTGFINYPSYDETEHYIKAVDCKLKKAQKATKKATSNTFTTVTPVTNEKNNNKGGIYGIFSINKNNEKKPLYVGLTTRDFKARWEEHKNILYGIAPVPEGMHKLYNLLREEYENNNLIAESIITFSELNTNRPLTQGEKEAMEFAIITLLKPPGNTSGISVPYYFSDTSKT